MSNDTNLFKALIPSATSGRFEVFRDRETMWLQEYIDRENWIVWVHEAEWELGIFDEHIEKATGDVLICGLGIGYCNWAIRNKRDVVSVDTVEREQDVIDLIWPYVDDDRSTIHHIDLDSFLARNTKKYDYILIDIYDIDPTEQPTESRALLNKVKRHLKRGGEAIFITWQGTKFT